MISSLWILLLFAFLVHVDSSDKWHFSGVLDCAKDAFRYHMVIYERDTSSADDPISRMSPRVSTKPHYYVADAEENGDEYDSFGYELYATIIHDCNTPDYPYRKLTFEMGRYSIMNKQYYKVINVTVTNMGELVPGEIIG